MITMWPASMLANSRTMSANGCVNMPRISTGIMIGSSHVGRPGGTRPDEVVHDAVLADARPLHGQEGHHGQAQGHADVAGRGRRRTAAARSSAATRMKKKKLSSSGVNLPPVVADVLLRDLVAHEERPCVSIAAAEPGGDAAVR